MSTILSVSGTPQRASRASLHVLPLGAVVEASGEGLRARRYRKTSPDAWVSLDGVIRDTTEGLAFDYPILTLIDAGTDDNGGVTNVMTAAGARPTWAQHSRLSSTCDDGEPYVCVEHYADAELSLDQTDQYASDAGRRPRVRMITSNTFAVVSAEAGRIELNLMSERSYLPADSFRFRMRDVDGSWGLEDARALRDALSEMLALADADPASDDLGGSTAADLLAAAVSCDGTLPTAVTE